MTPEELARSKQEALRLSDAELGVLLRQGAEGVPGGAWEVLLEEKARREARELSDAALGKLLRQGPDSEQAGAWDVLKQEEERRWRSRAAALRNATPSSASDEEEERRYPALRAFIAIHQGLAVLALVLGIGIALKAPDLAGVIRVGVVLAALLVGLVQWALAESLQVVIDIEANTRRTCDTLLTRR